MVVPSAPPYEGNEAGMTSSRHNLTNNLDKPGNLFAPEDRNGTQHALNETKKREKTRARRKTFLVKAAGYIVWAVAPPLMFLGVILSTPPVDDEDLYDDPLIPWRYHRKQNEQPLK